jgi:hypothetical protein
MRSTLLALLVTVASVSTLAGQGRPIELGAGIGVFAFQSGGGAEAIQVRTGGGGVYFGVPLSEQIAIEPAVAIDFTHVESVDVLVAGFGLSLPFYLQNYRQGFYISPFGALSFINADAAGVGDSDLQFGVGGSLGGKFPVGERVSFRIDVPIGYAFESNYRASTFTLGMQLMVGVFLGGRSM